MRSGGRVKPAYFIATVDKIASGAIDILLAAELLAYKECVHVRAQPADGGIVADSGFRDDRFSFRDMASEALGSF